MNRQQRRAAERAKPSYLRGTHDQKVARLMKQGISPDDLRNEWEEGYKLGCTQGMDTAIKSAYAAILITLKHQCHFGHTRATRFLREVDSLIVNSLTSIELIDQALAETGVKLDFDGPDRIREVAE